MYSVAAGQRGSFFIKADAAILQTKHKPPPPTSRPTAVAPIFDTDYADQALNPYSIEFAQEVYPINDDIFAPAAIPRRPDNLRQCGADRYLFPVLTRNERLRLTMLFYYTRGALEDAELQSRLLEKVHLARETVGWEFVIAGLLDHNTYTRMATVGLPLAVLPRRESTCAHTVNQRPGTVFSLLDMAKDWRFKQSPHVEEGGLRAYAGVPLRFETDFRDHIAFGSLCVASNSPQASLDKSQQQSLARLADWIVDDIIHSARLRRQRERQWMLELLAEAEKQCSKGVNMEAHIPEMLRPKYPSAKVCVCKNVNGEILMEGGTVLKTIDLQDGLWEDTEYFDHIIQERNHQDMVAPRVVRVISSQCASQRTPTFLLVGSQDFRDVYDDIDLWFVRMCAGILCRYWQGLALKDALHAKEAFLRGITHQLRTPIHGILGSVELLSEELKSRNAVPQIMSSSSSSTPDVETLNSYVYLKTIRTAAKELTSTVNNLIKLNQWADDVQTERTTAFYNIRDIETALLDDALPALPEDISLRPSIVFHHNFPPYLDMLSIDFRLLLDCIQPLVINAIQNADNGVIIVTLTYVVHRNRLVIDVEDNGQGMAPYDHERIFTAHEKLSSCKSGAGLGLTIASKLAKLLSGSVSLVSSEIGKGTHFRAAFDEITCASSFPPRQLIKQRLVQLPSTFHEVSSPLTPLSLCHTISKFLVLQGYTASNCREGSLLLLDYTQDLNGLYQDDHQLLTDVAICPIPESVMWSIDFQNSRVQRKNNIIYVKAPLLSSTLEEALELANGVMKEPASLSSGRSKCHFGGEALGTTESAPYPPVIDSVPGTQFRGSISALSLQTEVVQPLRGPYVEKLPPKLPLNTQIQAAKPMTLLVDDNHVNLRLLEMYCNRRSIPYRAVKDGKEAVSIFSRHRAASMPTFDPLLRQELATTMQLPFGLILMDLQMPICDGIAATRRIRELERENGWGRSIISIVTGQDSPSDRENADGAGADGYLVKPVGPRALDRWIKQWFPGANSG